jgi:hypothetical protein
MPALIIAIAAPLNGAGTSATVIRSLIAANKMSTKEKPTAAPKPYKIDSINPLAFLILSKATPSTAQFVVIKGRKIPSTLCNRGLVL